MKILVTGSNGMLGSDTARAVTERGHELICSGRSAEAAVPVPGGSEYVQLDLRDAGTVSRAVAKLCPDAVIHCAAWTNVETAELAENRGQVFAANSLASRNLAQACREQGCKMLYISTDYVFGGEGSAPHAADCKTFAPLNVYGESKLAGENAVAEILNRFFIVRTSWLYGVNGGNFVRSILKAAAEKDELSVVNDQTGTPTYSADLARLIVKMAETEKYGFYHAANSGGYISWFDFAQEIVRQARLTVGLVPVSADEYGAAKARRPHNSRLDMSKLEENGFQPLPHWRDALSRYLRAINAENRSE